MIIYHVNEEKAQYLMNNLNKDIKNLKGEMNYLNYMCFFLEKGIYVYDATASQLKELKSYYKIKNFTKSYFLTRIAISAIESNVDVKDVFNKDEKTLNAIFLARVNNLDISKYSEYTSEMLYRIVSVVIAEKDEKMDDFLKFLKKYNCSIKYESFFFSAYYIYKNDNKEKMTKLRAILKENKGKTIQEYDL